MELGFETKCVQSINFYLKKIRKAGDWVRGGRHDKVQSQLVEESGE